MDFHGILVVRDEADIIENTLRHLDAWCDNVYVYDTGSIDGTWGIVRELRSELSSLNPLEREPVQFDDTVRAYVFNRVRDQFENGDWVLRLDGDEFYEIPPPEFVQRYLKPHETAVYNQTYEFGFTEKDLEAWHTDEGKGGDAPERLQYFRTLDWAEPRMFQYRSSMAWPEDTSGPIHAGYVARCRIPVRHYPHRSPQQIQKRCALRSSLTDYMDDVFDHWQEDRWREFVAESGNLQKWTSDTQLEVQCDDSHTASSVKRAVSYILHRSFVCLVDRVRRRFTQDYAPPPLPDGFQERLRKEYPERGDSSL